MASDALRDPRSTDGLGLGAGLALLAHVGLIAALALNVNWRREEVAVVSAELWSSLPPSPTLSATPPPRVDPLPPPPVPKPVPRPPIPTPKAPMPEANIATEKKHDHPAPKPDLKKESMAKEAKEAKEKADKMAEAKTKAEAAKAKATELREAQQAEDRRAKTLEEMRKHLPGNSSQSSGQAGGSATQGAPAAAYSPSAGYAGRVRARIFPNIVYTGRALGNPTAEVEIKLSQDGTILNTRLIRPSGLPDWDEAVLRAIERTAQLPLDLDGHIPAKMVLSFDPNKR